MYEDDWVIRNQSQTYSKDYTNENFKDRGVHLFSDDDSESNFDIQHQRKARRLNVPVDISTRISLLQVLFFKKELNVPLFFH